MGRIRQPAVSAVLRGPAFRRFHANPQGATPVGALDPEVQGWLGVKTPLVLMPARIMRKQKGELKRFHGHPELSVEEDYPRLPTVMEKPEWVLRLPPRIPAPPGKVARRLHLIRTVDGKTYDAIVERMPTRSGTHLLSFFEIANGEGRVRAMARQAQAVFRKPPQ